MTDNITHRLFYLVVFRVPRDGDLGRGDHDGRGDRHRDHRDDPRGGFDHDHENAHHDDHGDRGYDGRPFLLILSLNTGMQSPQQSTTVEAIETSTWISSLPRFLGEWKQLLGIKSHQQSRTLTSHRQNSVGIAQQKFQSWQQRQFRIDTRWLGFG